MTRSLLLLLLAALTSSLVLEINNIHYGYRNIYNCKESTIAGSVLSLKDYVTTKSQLTSDVLGFITATESEVAVEMSLLVKQYSIEELDPSNPFLMFKFIQKPHIIVSIHSETQSDSEIQTLNLLSTQGQDPSEEL